LPADIAPHVFGATLDPESVLTVLVDSGAFATRLRFLLPELLPALAATLEGGAITRTVVRVRPRG
jgi:Dna[CI] antecedent, DciA